MKLAAKFIIYMLAEDNAQTIGAGGEPTAVQKKAGTMVTWGAFFSF
jgi:hypothetical protein